MIKIERMINAYQNDIKLQGVYKMIHSENKLFILHVDRNFTL